MVPTHVHEAPPPGLTEITESRCVQIQSRWVFSAKKTGSLEEFVGFLLRPRFNALCFVLFVKYHVLHAITFTEFVLKSGVNWTEEELHIDGRLKKL